MLPSLNVSANMVLAQQTADKVAAADSSFMFYLFKLSVCYISGNFLLSHQQQTGRRGVSKELLEPWESPLPRAQEKRGQSPPVCETPTIQAPHTQAQQCPYSQVL